jgi:predicted HTH transcriptional regulator
MTSDEVLNLIQQGESETLEFKLRLPDTHSVAKQISAFANTQGGVLIIGVGDDGNITGVDNLKRTYQVLEQAVKQITPAIKLQPDTVSLNSKKVVIVKIEKGNSSPYFAENQAFQRTGAATILLTASKLYENIQTRSTTPVEILKEVKQLTAVIEQLNMELLAAKSWRIKIADWVLGGIIGALISLALAILLG